MIKHYTAYSHNSFAIVEEGKSLCGRRPADPCAEYTPYSAHTHTHTHTHTQLTVGSGVHLGEELARGIVRAKCLSVLVNGVEVIYIYIYIYIYNDHYIYI